MPTVDISETNTRQMEREFTKLYLYLYFFCIGCLWLVLLLYIRQIIKKYRAAMCV